MGTTREPTFCLGVSWSQYTKYKMKVFLCLSVLASSVLAMPAAEAEAEADPQLLALGYHAVVPVVPLCKHTLETTTQEVCRLEPKKVCETKTQTYTKFTGYEKGDCKEIEVCKAPVWRKRDPLRPHLMPLLMPSAMAMWCLSARRRLRRSTGLSPPLRRLARTWSGATTRLKRSVRMWK